MYGKPSLSTFALSIIKIFMKVIVPTDFSSLSRIALQYAARFSSLTGTPLILVHNVTLEGLPKAGVLVNLEDKMENTAQEDLALLAADIRNEIAPPPDIFIEVSRAHDAAESILDKARTHNAGLIIMGTRGASGLSGTFLGSVSAEVIRKSTLPVLVVPSLASFSGNGEVYCAINPADPPTENSLKQLAEICKLLKRTPHFFCAGYHGTEPEITALRENIRFLGDSRVFTSPETDPEKAIESFLSNNPCMILVIDPKRHSFFERIMGKSITTKLISQLETPILTLP